MNFIIKPVQDIIKLNSGNMQPQKQLVLLFGGTGKSGFHIASRLLESSNYPVRIVVRNKSKALDLFKQKQMAFESIIQGDLSKQQTLKKAFQQSKFYGKVKIVISALGAAGFQSQSKISQLQSTELIKIIQFSKQNKINKFILITAAFIQRPWNPIPVIINSMVPNVYHYKAITENALRKSGLSYIIVRPPQLRGKQNDVSVTSYKLSQGDNVSGYISRRTLSHVVFDSINSLNIPSKVTFQCKAVKQKLQQDFSLLKQDSQKSIVNASHRLAKYTYWAIISLGYVLGGYYLFKKYFNASVQL